MLHCTDLHSICILRSCTVHRQRSSVNQVHVGTMQFIENFLHLKRLSSTGCNVLVWQHAESVTAT